MFFTGFFYTFTKKSRKNHSQPKKATFISHEILHNILFFGDFINKHTKTLTESRYSYIVLIEKNGKEI